MFGKVLGFVLTALPGVAGFAAYGMAQNKGMSQLSSAALAGAAFAAADIGGQLLSGGIAGLTFENIGAITEARSQGMRITGGSRIAHGRPGFAPYAQKFGYLVPQSVGACFGQC
jgi:hypothetical protein